MAAAAVSLVCADPVRAAAETRFNPSVELRVFTNGNVNVTDFSATDEGGDAKDSDLGASIGLSLPLTWTRPRSTVSLAYRTAFQLYGDNEEADDLSHNLSASYARSLTRQSRFHASLSGSRSEQQAFDIVAPEPIPAAPGTPGTPAPEPPGGGPVPTPAPEAKTLVPRTTVTNLSGNVGGRIGLGERSYLSYGVSGGVHTYEDVVFIPENTRTGADVIAFTDSRYAGASAGWGTELSARTSVGLGYGYTSITYGDPPPPVTVERLDPLPPGTIILETLVFQAPRDTVAHNLYLTGERSLGPNTTGSLQVGAVRAESEATAEDPEASRVEPSLHASLQRVVSEQSTLVFGLQQSVGTGDHVIVAGDDAPRGATLDRGAYGIWQWHRPKLSASVLLAYWMRERLDEDLEGDDTKTFQISETFGWTPGDRFSYGVFHGFRDQKAEEGGLKAKGYHSGGIFVRWNIMGRRERVGSGNPA